MPINAKKARQDALQRVLRVARELSASADLKQILSVIIDAVRDLLEAERATVFEYDAKTEELFATVAHGLGGKQDDADAEANEIRFPISKGLAGECGRTKEIINIPDAHQDPRFNPEFDRKTGFVTRQVLTIPLVSFDDELVGVAQVLNKRRGMFTDKDEEIALALAGQAAVALKRCRLIEDRIMRQKLERDLELARRIQQRSFPSSLPQLDQFEIEAWSEPAEQTGGDTYDVIGFPCEVAETLAAGTDTPVDRALFLMADATGHGIGPALSVTQVRSMLRIAARMDSDLTSIAVHMNQQLCHDMPEGRFITAWLGDLDVATSTLTSFSAGQGPLIKYEAATGACHRTDADTIPFGLLPTVEINISQRLIFEPGDIYAVISDGIYESMNASGEEFGAHRVEEILRQHCKESACGISLVLRQEVDAFTNNAPAADDRTVIIIKRV